MLTVDEARSRILAAFSQLDTIDVPILESPGRVLAADLIATENIPPFRNSAMDGYAVRSADVAGASAANPIRLRLIGEAAAGHLSRNLVSQGTAVRIMTGAPVPDGADSVLRFEDVDTDADPDAHPDASELGSITMTHPAQKWQNVRESGEDVARGSLAIARGTLIKPWHIGLLAALNQSTVSVIRPPRVAILATGDEVVDLGPPLDPGQIRNSNSYLLAALVRQFGGNPQLLGIARDSERDIIEMLSRSVGSDLLLTSGGVSVGDFDVVKQVLRQEGDIDLWQVRMKPGKPLAFGQIGGTPLLGLPGNPAAAFVAFVQFGRPAIRRMLGLSNIGLVEAQARLLKDVKNFGSRRNFLRAKIARRDGEFVVSPVAGKGSGSLYGLSQANCFIVVPEETDHILHDSIVNVEIFDDEFRF